MFDRFLLSEFSHRTARRTLARLPVLKNLVWSTGLQEMYPHKPPPFYGVVIDLHYFTILMHKNIDLDMRQHEQKLWGEYSKM